MWLCTVVAVHIYVHICLLLKRCKGKPWCATWSLAGASLRTQLEYSAVKVHALQMLWCILVCAVHHICILMDITSQGETPLTWFPGVQSEQLYICDVNMSANLHRVRGYCGWWPSLRDYASVKLWIDAALWSDSCWHCSMYCPSFILWLALSLTCLGYFHPRHNHCHSNLAMDGTHIPWFERA